MVKISEKAKTRLYQGAILCLVILLLFAVWHYENTIIRMGDETAFCVDTLTSCVESYKVCVNGYEECVDELNAFYDTKYKGVIR